MARCRRVAFRPDAGRAAALGDRAAFPPGARVASRPAHRDRDSGLSPSAGELDALGGKHGGARSKAEYFAHFPETDFFPFELRQAAEYLRRHTEPAERVQSYGMDPYVLFLAGRESATPYIYAYDLNADAALAGGTGGRPNPAQAARILAIRDANEADMLRRLETSPPAAFVFIDGSPLLSTFDAWEDFQSHCAHVAAWVRPRFREAARFGHDHVWLRLDRDPGSRAPDEERIDEPEEEEPPPRVAP